MHTTKPHMTIQQLFQNDYLRCRDLDLFIVVDDIEIPMPNRYDRHFEFLPKILQFVERVNKKKYHSPRTSPAKPKATISPALRKQVFERDAYRCQECGTWEDLTVDHIIPESRGGTLDPGNLQTLCRPCNSKKGNRITST